MLDLSGALLGYATASRPGRRRPRSRGASGSTCARSGDGAGVNALAYARDPERVRGKAPYRALLGPEAELGVVLRPMSPDCGGPDNLRGRGPPPRRAPGPTLRAHALPSLDWIAAALGAE